MPSSVIRLMIYDPVAQLLQIVFRATGEIYQYRDVPVDEWLRFQQSTSKGTYLNQNFKEKGFRFDHHSPGKAPDMPHGSLIWPNPSEESVANDSGGDLHHA